jgi:prepilin-type N-terminal cleavage/methylation domain-containing protein
MWRKGRLFAGALGRVLTVRVSRGFPAGCSGEVFCDRVFGTFRTIGKLRERRPAPGDRRDIVSRRGRYRRFSQGKGGPARRNKERIQNETAVKNLPGGGLFPLICRRNPLRRAEGEGARRKRDGFTLVEVIVVLVILAILAAIAIPALTGYIDKANTSQIKAKARSAAVAMQTILAEAYADPQTRLPVALHDDNGQLYLDGESFARIDIDESSGMYTFFNTDESRLLDLFRKLDASSIIQVQAPPGEAKLAMMHVLFDEHFSLLAYTYFDPETYYPTYLNYETYSGEMRVCSYNYLLNESNNNFVYDSSAGFKVWGTADGDIIYPIG